MWDHSGRVCTMTSDNWHACKCPHDQICRYRWCMAGICLSIELYSLVYFGLLSYTVCMIECNRIKCLYRINYKYRPLCQWYRSSTCWIWLQHRYSLLKVATNHGSMDQFRVRLLGRCLAIGAWVMVHGVVSYAQIWPRVCPAAAGLFLTLCFSSSCTHCTHRTTQ